MIVDRDLATQVAKKLQESYRLLDESAFDVRQRASLGEVDRYVHAVGRVCAEIIFELMEPLYREHPELAPEGWGK